MAGNFYPGRLTLSGVFPGVNSVTVMIGLGTEERVDMAFGGMGAASDFLLP
jgi:hypothetical protein